MIWIIFILVIGIIFYLYTNNLDSKTEELEMDYNLANTYINEGEFIKAISILDQAIIKNPKNYQLYNNRGEAKYQLGKFEEALQDFRASIECYPRENNNPRAYGNVEKVLETISRLNH